MKNEDRPLHIKSKLARDEEHAGLWMEQGHLIKSDDDNLVDQYVVGECVHVTTRTVRTWTRAGILTAKLLGRKPYYFEEDIVAMLKSKRDNDESNDHS